MKKLSMITQISLALFIGIIVGIIFPESNVVLQPIGEIFLRLMQMAIPLLILGQIIQALGGIQLKELTSIGARTMAAFAVSSFLAAAWRIVIAVFFHPGQGISLIESHETIQVQEISLQETLINFVPKNIF